MEIALVAEGGSDRILIEPLRWLCHDINPDLGYEFEAIDFSQLTRKLDMAGKISAVLRQGRHHILLIHRDQDSAERDSRLKEIHNSISVARNDVTPGLLPQTIPVIPIRMTEAWFLINESAIRSAAGCPHGKTPLQLPKVKELESINDPKALLHAAIRTASDRKGRHLKKVRPNTIVHTLARRISDYSALDGLSAFRELRGELSSALQRHNG